MKPEASLQEPKARSQRVVVKWVQEVLLWDDILQEGLLQDFFISGFFPPGKYSSVDVLPSNFFIYGKIGLWIIYSIECFTLMINYSLVHLLFGIFHLWTSYSRIIYPKEQLLCRILTLKFFWTSDYLLQRFCVLRSSYSMESQH